MPKTTEVEFTVEDRDKEIERLDQLVLSLDGFSIPAIALEQSLEECRSLNDKLGLVRVEALKIDSPALYTDYGSFFRRIKDIEKKIEEQRIKDKAGPLEEGRRIDAKYGGFKDFAKRLRTVFDYAMNIWDREQKRIQREEEVRLREKARKEQEKLDLRAEKKAAKLEDEGKTDEADAVREAVPIVPTPTVAPADIPKVAGVTKVKRWKAEITAEALDKQEKLLIEMIKSWNAWPKNRGKEIIPGEFWSLDVKAINAMARSLKGKLELPDVDVFDADTRH
ncbi:MAG: hypothetical protein GY896_22750 [Gammaproteobacteria bacterium]|nr:hypothetical protein [Gammaproteobacteria bacterium]